MKIFLSFIILSLLTVNSYANDFSLTDDEQAWLDTQTHIPLSTAIAIPNFSMLSEQGDLSGLIYDYFALLSQTIAKPITFVPFDEGQYSAEKVMAMDDVYGHSMVFDSTKNKRLYALTQPYMHTALTVFTSRNLQDKINNIADLQQRKVAVLQPLTKLEFLQDYPDIQLSRVPDRLSLLNKIQYESVDAIIGSEGFHHLIKENLYTNIVPAFTIKNQVPMMIGVKPQYPQLVSILNKAITAIPAQALTALYEKWFTDHLNNNSWNAQQRAYIQANPVLTVPNLSTFPPFSFNENGVPMGYTVDYLNLLAEYIGVKIHYIQDKTWAESLQMLKNGEIDFIPHIAVTEQRKKFVDYTSFNHVQYTTGIAVQRDSVIHSFVDLQDKVIAVTEKSFIHTYIQEHYPKQQLLVMNSDSAGIEAVSSGAANAVIGSLPALHYYVQKNWLSNIKIIDRLGLVDKTKLPMGVVKGNDILLSIIEKAQKMILPTEVAALKEKWINLPTPSHNNIKLTVDELSYLSDKKEIRLCVNPDWPPFESIENGKHLGITAEYMTIFQKDLLIPIKLVATKNFQQTLAFAKQRRCDIVSVLPETQENLSQFAMSKPYINTSIVLATKVKTPFINDISSLNSQPIGVLKDCFCEQVLRERYPDMQLTSLDSSEQGLVKVSREELFGFIGAFPVLAPLIQEDFIGDVKIAGKLENGKGFSLGIRNDQPELLSIFNKLIDNIPANTHQEIISEFVSFNIESSIDYTKLLYITLFFLLVLLVVLYKNRSISIIHKQLTRAHNKLKEQQEMVNKYVLMVATDCSGVITEVNDAYCRSLGYSRAELLGKTHKNLRHPDMEKQFFQQMWKAISHDKTWIGEMLNYTKDQQVKCFNAYIEPVFRNGTKVGYRAICEDISDKKRVEELSITDKLTGIYNRLKLDELIVEQVNSYQRYNLNFSIILIDVDDFKRINDRYGHDVGDYILQTLAGIFQQRVRATDYIGRWGGEEFLLICPNTTANNALIAAEYIRASVEQETFKDVGKLTLSLGVSGFLADDSINSIFKRADKALYMAKKSGKNTSRAL